MVFFRKRMEEEKARDVGEIKRTVEGKPIEKGKPPELLEKPVIEMKKSESPTFAPLFVKIDRYRFVLDLLNDLKATVMMVKNAIVIQKSIESLANENRSLIESAMNKIEEKILSLDSEFVRPRGYKEEAPIIQETKGLEGVVDDLKTQIEELKTEVKEIS